MKKSIYIIAAFVVSGFMLQAGQVKAQSSVHKKEKAEQEKQFAEQKKAIEEAYTLEQEQKYRQARDLYRIQERGTGYVVAPPQPPHLVGLWKGSENSFNLSLKKLFKGESATKETKFTVDDDQSKLRFSVKGRCEEGTIAVSFSLPSGKLFTKIPIDSSADIEWSQSLTMEEKSIYKGQWKVEVKATNAKGMYSVSISSY